MLQQLTTLVHEPMCLLYLAQALLYLAAAVAILFGHRRLLGFAIYAASAVVHLATAAVHGGIVP